MTQTDDKDEKAPCRWCEVFIIGENKCRRLCHLTPESRAVTDDECKNCEHYERCDEED